MAIGYEGLARLNNVQVLFKNGSVSRQRPILNSEGTYGASTASTAVGNVHLYDFDMITASCELDVNSRLLSLLFNDWVQNRETPKQITWWTKENQILSFVTDNDLANSAYWTSINLSTSSGSLVNCSLSFEHLAATDLVTIPVHNLEVAYKYIYQKFGFSSPLDQGDPTERPLAYWQTRVDNLPTNVEVLDWSLTINSPFEKRFTCEGVGDKDTHPAPAVIFVGLANVEFSATIIYLSEVSSVIDLPTSWSNITIRFNTGEALVIPNLEMQTHEVPVAAQGEPITYSFKASGFFELPYLL